MSNIPVITEADIEEMPYDYVEKPMENVEITRRIDSVGIGDIGVEGPEIGHGMTAGLYLVKIGGGDEVPALMLRSPIPQIAHASEQNDFLRNVVAVVKDVPGLTIVKSDMPPWRLTVADTDGNGALLKVLKTLPAADGFNAAKSKLAQAYAEWFVMGAVEPRSFRPDSYPRMKVGERVPAPGGNS